jgi:hypothetical protein
VTVDGLRRYLAAYLDTATEAELRELDAVVTRQVRARLEHHAGLIDLGLKRALLGGGS